MNPLAFGLLLLGLILSLHPSLLRAADLSSPLTQWNGEYMSAGQGALYGRFYLDNFRRTRSFREITNSVFMNIRNLKTGQVFVMSQSPTESRSDPILIWKLPQGTYTVDKLSINENTGITRTWTPSGKRPLFTVKHLHLSNLGMIRLSPFGKLGLKVVLLSGPNLYETTTSHEAFAAVVDAYKGKVQKVLGGKNLLKDAKDNFGLDGEARTAFTLSRQISMIYQVNSNGTQANRRLLSSTISGQDAELRRCYMDQLDLQLGLRGSVSYNFQIASQNGSFAQLRYSGGSLNSPKTVECLTLALRKLQFPVNKALVGQLAFQFNYDDNPGRAKFP